MPALASKEAQEGDCSEQDEWKTQCPDSEQIEARVREHMEELVEFTKGARDLSFFDYEQSLIPLVFMLGRLLLALFLCRGHEEFPTRPSEVIAGKRYQRRMPRGRELGTFFGKVRYWRTYMYAGGGGYYPLDQTLKLPKDGFSTHLTGLMSRLATKMSYVQVTVVLRCFLAWSPAHKTVEESVLGLGRRTTAWFEQAPAPEDDGEVLIIEIDGKAPPTATEAELEKRRGKRKPPRVEGSPRHRGRERRRERGPKKRRKKGDHSKNGKMVSTLVMFTLKRGVDVEGNEVLIGPINRRVYASFAAKRHAFAIAQREAIKRGFKPGSGKTIQIVTDGDTDLALYAKEFFPDAIHTLDFFHAMEYVWQAGRSLHKEGKKALDAWAGKQRRRLRNGKIELIMRELRKALRGIPKTGPGNKGKRERLAGAIGYLERRVHMMNYKELRDRDLEISSGSVEGAVNYVVAQRFDSAGMRWIKERAEALLQLRCIEINGDWDDFMRFVHVTGAGSEDAPPHGVALHAKTPAPLPTFGLKKAG